MYLYTLFDNFICKQSDTFIKVFGFFKRIPFKKSIPLLKKENASEMNKQKWLRNNKFKAEYSHVEFLKKQYFWVLKTCLDIFFWRVFSFKKKKFFKNLRLRNKVLRKNFLKKKLPLLIFLLVKIFLYFFLFRKTIESRLDTKTLSLNFFLKKRFFFLLNKINVLLLVNLILRYFLKNLYKYMYIYMYNVYLLRLVINCIKTYLSWFFIDCFKTYFVNPGSNPIT